MTDDYRVVGDVTYIKPDDSGSIKVDMKDITTRYIGIDMVHGVDYTIISACVVYDDE